jgi:hypothetical protein
VESSTLEYQLTDDKLLFFLHIPKTAGTTFDTILRQHFPGNSYSKIKLFLFNQLPGNYYKAHRCYSGHVSYDMMAKFLPLNTACVTFLRDPVDQILSAYAYNNHKFANWNMPTDLLEWMSIFTDLYLQPNVQAFVDHPDFQLLSNGQTAVLGDTYNFKNYADFTATI